MLVTLAPITGVAHAQTPVPSWTKTFSPATIGPGSVSTLRFEITNNTGSPVSLLAFTDDLSGIPVTIATPANASDGCNGTLTAPDGGNLITYSGGSLGNGRTCTITVDVTSSTADTHLNTTGDLTSSAGNSGATEANLTVDATLPGFSKSFSPATLDLGERSTLTFLVDNSAPGTPVASMSFTDTLPVGVVIADPSNASTDCQSPGGFLTLTADPGTGFISYGYFGTVGVPAVGGNSTCTVQVDVIGTGAGVNVNSSDTLIADDEAAGKANASLTVTTATLHIQKDFVDDPAPPGGTVTLEFTITNFDRDDAASGISFTDDFPAGSGLTATGLPATDVCGTGSTLSATTLPDGVALTGGSLPAGGSCTFSVVLAIDSATLSGEYVNESSTVTGDIGGSPVTGNTAKESVFIEAAPVLTKEFTDDPVGGGGVVTLQFTLTNTSSTASPMGIAFTDDLPDVITTSPSGAPSPDPCGSGSVATFSPRSNPIGGGGSPATFSLTGGSLNPAGTPGDSCTFSLTLNVEQGAAAGLHPNVTSKVTATAGGSPVTGPPASDDLEVVGGPILSKDFTDDPVAPGGQATLEFTISHDEFANDPATAVTFTDDLTTMGTGFTGAGLSVTDACGPGNGTITGSAGDTLLTFSGGTLNPGEECVVPITIDVAINATLGLRTNDTSTITADVGGVTAVGPATSAQLIVTPLTFTKEFTNDPVFPGGTVTLDYTITNTSGTDTATAIIFQDNFNNVVNGMTVDPPPTTPCGPSSSLTRSAGNTLLTLSGGELAPGAFCTFSVTLNVPSGTADGAYPNVTQNQSATIGSFNGVPFGSATDELIVESPLPPLVTKQFVNDPVQPGKTVTLRFTVENPNDTEFMNIITFDDDLDATLPGLTASLPPNPDPPCGAGSAIVLSAGNSLLTLDDGQLAAGATCTFDVTLNVPANAGGGSYPNTTSDPTGDIDVFGTVTGIPATDTLVVQDLDLVFTKSFTDDPVLPGGQVTLQFTIDSSGSTTDALDLSFQDNLNTTLAGLAATGLPASNVCGPGSQLSGTSTLSLTGGNLPAGGQCTFSVTLNVPAGALEGTYPNTTTSLRESGQAVAPPATDSLVVEQPNISITKDDGVTSAVPGTSITYTITVTNNGTLTVGPVAVDDAFPPELSCTWTSAAAGGATGNTPAGSGDISDSLTMPGASSVTYTADCAIDPAATGTLSNTATAVPPTMDISPGDNSATDSDQLTPEADMAIAKVDQADPVLAGETVTYRITVDNFGPSNATNVTVVDTVPAGFMFDSATVPCTPGVPGPGQLTCDLGDMPASAQATFDVTFAIDPATPAGTNMNTVVVFTAVIDPNMANDVADEDTTVETSADLSVTKTDNPDPVVNGGTLTYTITVTNAGPSDAQNVVATDTLPADVSGAVTSGCAEDPGGVPTCSLGTIAAGASKQYTITVTVNESAPAGPITNRVDVTSDTPDPVGPPQGEANNNTAIATTRVNVQAGLVDIQKATNGLDADTPPGPAITIGDPVNWTYVVTNTGPVTLTDVTVTDDQGVAVSCPQTTLAPGESMTCTASGTAQQGQYANVGRVTAKSPDERDVTDSDPSHYLGVVANPAIAVEKATNGADADGAPGPSLPVGSQVTWTYRVTNTGNADLTGVTVTDDQGVEVFCQGTTPPEGGGPAPNGQPFDLAVGESDTCVATGTVTAGQYANVATAQDDSVPPVSDDDPSHYFGVVPGAAVIIEKSTNGEDADDPPGPLVPVGALVGWTYEVTNVGDAPLTGVTVTDSRGVAVTCPKTTLAVGESMTCTASGTAQPGIYMNVGTVRAQASGNRTASASDPSHYLGQVDGPSIDVEKSTNGRDADTPRGPFIPVGARVTWTYVVANNGTVPLTGVTVTDDQGVEVFCQGTTPPESGGPAPNGQPFDLAVGEADTCTAIDTAQPGQYANVATASGTPPSGPAVSSTDPSHYIGANPADTADVRIEKTGPPSVVAGNQVVYTVTVVNDGPATATDVVVTDTLPAGVTFVSTSGCAEDPAGVPTCSLGSIAARASKQFMITVRLPSDSTLTSISNTASVNASTVDPQPDNDTATSPPTNVTREADLSIDKTGAPNPVVAGQNLTYEIVVVNSGPSDATGVKVVDTLPAGVTYVSDTDACVEAPPGTLTCSLGTIPAGTSKTFEVTVKVGAGTTGALTNTARVSSDVPDPDATNDEAATDTAVIQSADLAITKTDAPDPVAAGQTLTYTVTVTNNGPSNAAGVTVVDTLPAGSTYVSDTDACLQAPAGTLTCSLGAVAAGASKSFDIVVQVGAGTTGTLTNTARVSAATPDPNGANDTAVTATRVVASADLSITKADSPDPVQLGRVVTYTVTVSNDGPSDATGVVVTDTLPAGVVQVRTSGCAGDPNGVPDCSLGTIAAGASKSYTITARVTGNTSRVLVNTASVSSAAADPVTSDNSATAFTTVSRPQQPEVGLFDPVTGRWTQLLRNGTTRTFTYGNPGDYGIVGDWDGDGDRTPGVFRTLNGDTALFARNSNSSGPADFSFAVGSPGDVPVAGDWNGNGRESLALFRPSSATWFVFFDFADVVPDAVFVFGNPGDAPAAVDIDGDGDADPVAHRDMGALGGRVFVRRSLTSGIADVVFTYGNPGDRILFGDYDYDGDRTVGVFRPGDATFYLRNSNSSGVANLTIPLGLGRELPNAGPY